MKKIFVFLSVILIILLIIFSRHDTSSQTLENLAYVIAIGFDTSSNNLMKLTLQIATPSSNSPGGNGSSSGSSESNESTITTVECTTLNSGLNIINSYISKKINLSHCKIVVFSEEFAKSGISDAVSSLVNSVEIRPDCSIVVSKCDANEFIKNTKPSLVTLMARFYEVVTRSGDYTGFSKNVKLISFYNSLVDNYSEPIAILAGINLSDTHSIPKYTNYVDIDSSYNTGQSMVSNQNHIQISGLAVFHNDKLVGELNSIETVCHLIVNNELENALINIPDPFNQNGLINLSLSQLDSPKISVKLVNGSPYISCKIKLQASIVALPSGTDYLSGNNLDIIADYANSYISSHIKDYLYKTSKEFKSDISGFGRFLIYRYATISEWENVKWRNNYKDSFFTVNVDTNISHSNLILKN